MEQRRPRIEWPTMALAATIYAGWIGLTLWSNTLPVWFCLPVVAILLTWHSSLQHEVLHGHPTRSRRLNHAIGAIPLSLWLPFEIYRATHLAHHRDERLTDPLDDPETFYWTPSRWAALGPVGRALVRAQTTLAGRLLIGPGWTIPRFLATEAARFRRGEPGRRRIWLRHAAGCVGVLAWLVLVCDVDVLVYVFACVYPSVSLLLLRSFAEHRAAADPASRTALVEDAGLFGPLFLFNNLHAVHHRHPALPWYHIPVLYRSRRAAFIAANDGLVYRGYTDVARRYWLSAHDTPIHPAATLSDPTAAATVGP